MSAVAVLIDEVQYFDQKELGALIVAMHKVQQRQLPLVLLGAGLPILPGLAGGSKTYSERVFRFPAIGAVGGGGAGRGRWGKRTTRARARRGGRFRSTGAEGGISPDQRLPVFSSGVGIPSLESGRGEPDYTAGSSKRHGNRHCTA